MFTLNPRTLYKYIFILVFTVSCKDGKRKVLGDTPFQKQLNAQYKDASKSPLTKKDRKLFKELPFYKNDSTYVVKATLLKSRNTNWFNMKTTTSRVAKQRLFGVVKFYIKDTLHTLNVYQGENKANKTGLDNYLFLPFLDQTNGVETYSGGRYIDLELPKANFNTLIIDFNKAYNPYCAYNEKYSCPIVPRQNYLKTKIEAGVKIENNLH